MTYLVLARKWRPMIFEDVVGQEHISRILMNALKNQRVAQAYIFSGPRGVGKTTMARLLAKSVNCENQPTINPCNQCSTCKSITNGHSLDVIEIDGASNRGIDEIRNLRENIRFSPAAARYKIYIIDEVHMLTKEAFNALLKTLEEPPPHAIFVFATTEIHRVPLTILSRCQRFDFRRIPVSHITGLLKKIAESEQIDIEDDALLLIARKADGSMRDAESILDQMISLGKENLSAEVVRKALGLIDLEVYFQFTDIIKTKNSAKVLEYARSIFTTGHDLVDYVHGLQEHVRNFLLIKTLQNTKLLDVSDYYKKLYEEKVTSLEEKDLIHYLQILIDAEQHIKFSAFPELDLEMLLLRIVHKPPSTSLEEILALIEKMKKGSGLDSNENIHKLRTEKGQSNRPTAHTDSKSASREDAVEEEVGKTTDKNFSSLEGTLKNLTGLKKQINKTKSEEKRPPDIDFSALKEKWTDIINRVRTEKIALGSFLEEGIPFRLDKSHLIIAYDKKASFHQEHVQKNSKVIEEILKRDFKLPLRIGFQTIDFESEGIERIPRTPEEILEDIKNKEPIIKKIIEVFDLDESSHTDQS